MEIERWNVERIAAYLGVTPKHTRENITTRPSFPAPVVNMSRRTRYWSAEAVRQWAAAPHASDRNATAPRQPA